MEDETIEFSIPCNLDEAVEARERVTRFAEDRGFGGHGLQTVRLISDETIVNAVDHGSALKPDMRVRIRCTVCAESLVLQVTDQGGRVFDPEFFQRIAAKKSWGYGGRGIALIYALSEGVMYVTNPGVSTTVTITIARDSRPAPV